jgi:hypothetical protein
MILIGSRYWQTHMATEGFGIDVVRLTQIFFFFFGGGFWFESRSQHRLTKTVTRLFRVREVTCSNSAHSAS